jgi:hypothetical protein
MARAYLREIFIVHVVLAVCARWLEYVNALALRARLAGLLTFVASFWKRQEYESPPFSPRSFRRTTDFADNTDESADLPHVWWARRFRQLRLAPNIRDISAIRNEQSMLEVPAHSG